MSIQDLQSDLLVDLSTEEQQDVSGGFGWGGYGLGAGLVGRKHGVWGGGFPVAGGLGWGGALPLFGGIGRIW